MSEKKSAFILKVGGKYIITYGGGGDQQVVEGKMLGGASFGSYTFMVLEVPNLEVSVEGVTTYKYLNPLYIYDITLVEPPEVEEEAPTESDAAFM